MEEDLQRELDRNAAATRMAMAREVEAQAAKKRCNLNLKSPCVIPLSSGQKHLNRK